MGVLVAGGVLKANLNTTQTVHQFHKSLKVNPGKMVHCHAGEVLDGQGQQLGAAGITGAPAQIGVHPAEILRAEVEQIKIAGNRDHRRGGAAFREEHQYDAVGQVPAGVGAHHEHRIEHLVGQSGGAPDVFHRLGNGRSVLFRDRLRFFPDAILDR